MCMALAVPALAGSVGSGDSISSGSGEVKYTAVVQEPTIDVTVPSASQAVVLNPYKISVAASASTVSGGAIATALSSSSSNNAILASTLYLHNKSTVPLKMSLTLRGEASATVAFSSSPLTGTTEKNKKVFIYAEVGSKLDSEPSASIAAPSTYDSSNTKQGVFKNGDLKMTEVMTIPVASTPSTGNWIPISLGGDCTTSPTSPWGASDTVNISMIFSFQAADTTVS